MTELLGSVVTGGYCQLPDGLERVPARSNYVGVVTDLVSGVRALTGVVQEQHQLVVEHVEVSAARQKYVCQARSRNVAGLLSSIYEHPGETESPTLVVA